MAERFGGFTTTATPTPTGVIVEEHLAFSFTTLCSASGADAAQLQALVEEGLLDPEGQGPDDWQFDGEALPRTRQALRLTRDLDLGPAGAAIVMDLLAEIAHLKSLLRRR